MIQAQQGIIPDKQYYHDPSIQNNQGNTVAMLLAQNGIIPPHEWNHDKFIINKERDTVAEMMVEQLIIPTQEWMISNEEKHVVFFKLQRQLTRYHLPIPRSTDPNNLTIFDQACYRIIPNIAGHSPKERDKDCFTVAMILAYNNVKIPQCWYHDPEYQSRHNQTVAMMFAYGGTIPPKEWQHQKFLRGDIWYGEYRSNCTVQKILQVKNIKVPKEWKYDGAVDDDDNTQAMLQAKQGKIPDKKYNHDRYQNNRKKEYVCTILAENRIIPSQDWMIEKEKYYNLLINQLPIPKHITNSELTIFDQACYHIIPDIANHKPNEQDEDGFTVAMILAINNIFIPKQWYHDPTIKNKYGYTVAFYQARNGKIPSKQWIHNKFARVPLYTNNTRTFTVQNLLEIKNVEVPDEWKIDNTVDIQENTQALLQAKRGQIPDQQYYHDPLQTDYFGCTVAMMLAASCIVPPKEWEHDPQIKCNVRETVGSIFAMCDMIPPKQWMITEQEDKEMFDKIRERLEIAGYKYINNQFIFNCKTEIINDICQICFTEDEQEFVKTTCSHKICLECFKQLLNQGQHKNCPFCWQKDWYEKYK